MKLSSENYQLKTNFMLMIAIRNESPSRKKTCKKTLGSTKYKAKDITLVVCCFQKFQFLYHMQLIKSKKL